MSETDLFQEPDDATPLDPALRGDLVQTWVTTRADLNEAEQENIVKGAAWARRRRGGLKSLLNEDFSKNLHKQMFGEVWKWAAKYRETELNIGIAPHLVTAEMPSMFDNIRFWVENKTFPPDEIAVRLHHRLAESVQSKLRSVVRCPACERVRAREAADINDVPTTPGSKPH